MIGNHAESEGIKNFHIGDILSVIKGQNLSPREIGGIEDLLGYMTGEDRVPTHQIPRLTDECAPSLKAQHPDLSEIIVPADSEIMKPGKVASWLGRVTARYGESRPVLTLNPVEHTHIDPLEEAADAIGPNKIFSFSQDSQDDFDDALRKRLLGNE